ncbi:MAG: hypothetical protein M3N54_05805 [Acidobacteriota bacterium]|nr:hypothetical protein [Acidobacteriota bacterium]
MDPELKQYFEGMERRIVERLLALEHRAAAKSDTYERTNELRMKQVLLKCGVLDERLMAVEEWVSSLERPN